MNAQEFIAHIRPHMETLYMTFLKEKSSFLSVLMANGRGKKATDLVYKWSDLQLAPKKWNYGGSAVTAANLNAGIEITLPSTAGMQLGMILRVTESGIRKPYQLEVTALNVNGTGATVKTYGGVNAASNLATGAVLDLLSRPMKENNKDFDPKSAQLPVIKENYTQIFESVFEISASAMAVTTFTDVNSTAYLLKQTFMDIERQMALQAWFGIGVKRDDANGKKGSFQGIDRFVSIVDTVSGALTHAMINDLGAEINSNGGSYDTVACNTAVARKFAGFNAAGNNPVITQDSTKAGNYVLSLVSDIPVAGGMVSTIFIDDSLDNNELFLVKKSEIALVPLAGRALFAEDATVKGQDGVTGLARGEYTLEIRGADYTHGHLVGFTI